MNVHIQKGQQIPSKINSKPFTSRHNKLLQTKDKILRSAGEKQLITCKESSMRLRSDFFIRNYEDQKAMGWHIHNTKTKRQSSKNSII